MQRSLNMLIMLFGLGACTTFPELDNSLSDRARDAKYPELVPLESLLAEADDRRIDADGTLNSVEARVARLRARASVLRRPVLSRQVRARLADRPT